MRMRMQALERLTSEHQAELAQVAAAVSQHQEHLQSKASELQQVGSPLHRAPGDQSKGIALLYACIPATPHHAAVPDLQQPPFGLCCWSP